MRTPEQQRVLAAGGATDETTPITGLIGTSNELRAVRLANGWEIPLAAR